MKRIALYTLTALGLYLASVTLFPVGAVTNNGFVILPPTPTANTFPMQVNTTPGNVAWQKVPVAGLVSSSVTVNGVTCTLGGSCAPSGGISGPLYSQIVTVNNNANSSANSMIDTTGALGSTSIASSVLNTAGNVLHVYISGTVST